MVLGFRVFQSLLSILRTLDLQWSFPSPVLLFSFSLDMALVDSLPVFSM